jgi:hypothetical protein
MGKFAITRAGKNKKGKRFQEAEDQNEKLQEISD